MKVAGLFVSLPRTRASSFFSSSISVPLAASSAGYGGVVGLSALQPFFVRSFWKKDQRLFAFTSLTSLIDMKIIQFVLIGTINNLVLQIFSLYLKVLLGHLNLFLVKLLKPTRLDGLARSLETYYFKLISSFARTAFEKHAFTISRPDRLKNHCTSRRDAARRRHRGHRPSFRVRGTDYPRRNLSRVPAGRFKVERRRMDGADAHVRDDTEDTARSRNLLAAFPDDFFPPFGGAPFLSK